MTRVYLSPPDVGPDVRRLVLEAIDSNWIAPLGPDVDAFEREVAELSGVDHAVALSSGTAALHLALLLLGVGPGDDVLVPSFTFVATASPVCSLGARPIFVDSSADSWNIDPDLVERELAERAKRNELPAALVTVDLYGQSADYRPLVDLSRHYGVPLVEDAAEALGASYHAQPLGSFGDAGVFSFNGSKIITTSGGGMLVTHHKPWAERARFLSTQARDPAPHYEHSTIGYNYRLSNLLAAVGRGQLRVLDERVQQRRDNFCFYRKALQGMPGIEFMNEHAYGRCTRWLTCITVDPDAFGASREEIRLALEQENIESRPVWKPMHLQPVFASCRVRGGAVAADLFDRGLCLPSGSNLDPADRLRVVEIIRSVCKAA